ncbi:MAG: hypothetical protein GKS00_08625 [Alphaproteobacteria bacterium]|nr:hypothetical protein [Alphaproteobacteria bacterium]
MPSIFEKIVQKPRFNISEHFKRYGLGAATLIIIVELLWVASVLILVLLVIGALFEFTNGWMAILPGFLGAVTFLIILTIGGFAAALPSTYVARWREAAIDRISRHYPHPAQSDDALPVSPEMPRSLEIQDAD